MTNLLISYSDIPSAALKWESTATFDEDQMQGNLYHGPRFLRGKQASADTTVKRTSFDLGSATTKTADHLIIARADVIETNNIQRIVVKQSSESGLGPNTTARPTGWWKANRSTVTIGGTRLISAITDLSGNGYFFVQGTDANKPSLSRPDNLENYLLQSVTFDSWSKTSCTVSTGAVTGPTNFGNADKLVEVAETAEHLVSQNFSVINGKTYQLTVWAKQGERTCVYFYTGGAISTFGQGANLATGAWVGGTPTGGSIMGAGNGFYKLSWLETATSTGSANLQIIASTNGSTTNYAGDITKGIYIAGAQVKDSNAEDTFLTTTTFAGFAGINANRMLRFDGLASKMTTTATLANLFGAQAKTVCIAVRPDFINATNWPIFWPSSGGIFQVRTGNAVFQAVNVSTGTQTVSSTGVTVTAGVTYIVTVRHDTTNLSIRVNGGSWANLASGASSDTTVTFLLGNNTGTNWFAGAIGEIVTFNSALSDADCARWEAYLTAEWITAPVYNNRLISSSTLYGPNSNDFITTFTETSASRHWWIDYDPNESSSNMEHSKSYLGVAFDFGTDPDFEISRAPRAESEFVTDSGARKLTRIDDPAYRWDFTWSGITDAKVQEWLTKIVYKKEQETFFLYTTANHQILDDKRIVHVRLTEASYRKIETDWNVVSASFEEVLG